MRLFNGSFNRHFLAVSVGLVYLWFGVLKFFPGISPAEDLAKNTIDALTLGFIPAEVSIILLALWETIIGLLLISNIYRTLAIKLALIHILLTFTPLVFFPEIGFNSYPVGLSLIGQYIVKNIIIIGALLTIYEQSRSKIEVGLSPDIDELY